LAGQRRAVRAVGLPMHREEFASFRCPLVEVHTRRALAAISAIVDSSEQGDSQNADKNLEWLGHTSRFALARWIAAVGRDTRGSRVL
jgi:hypothetical protein